MPVEPKLGTLVDVAIKGVRVVGHPSSVFVRIADEHGDAYRMPPHAAITQTRPDVTDIATLQERIGEAIGAIDDFVDEQKLDPWTAHWLRKTLDPNPRHWPPQAGDVWDDGLPFGGSLWFACEYPAKADDPDQTPMIGMVSVAGGSAGFTPHRLLELHPEIKLVFRRDGDQ